jgi:hypothetical protein
MCAGQDELTGQPTQQERPRTLFIFCIHIDKYVYLLYNEPTNYFYKVGVGY